MWNPHCIIWGMLSEIDAFRAAKLLMDRFSSGALSEALRRAAEFRVNGDDAGSRAWLKISGAIMFLQEKSSPPGEKAH